MECFDETKTSIVLIKSVAVVGAKATSLSAAQNPGFDPEQTSDLTSFTPCHKLPNGMRGLLLKDDDFYLP